MTEQHFWEGELEKWFQQGYQRGLEDAAKKAERMPSGDGWERRIAAAIRALAEQARNETD